MDVLSRAEFAAAKGRKLVRGANVVQAYQFWHSGGSRPGPAALVAGATGTADTRRAGIARWSNTP